MIRFGWLLVSVSLHGALIFWLTSMDSAPFPPEDLIKVEIREPKTESEDSRIARDKAQMARGKRQATRGKSKRTDRGGKGLSRFVPSGAGLFQPKDEAYYDKIYAEAKGSSEWPDDAWGSHGNAFSEYAEHIGHLDQLREEIENMLYYPGVLARHKIQGVINARITFGEGSRCAFKKTRVAGAQPFLRVYILALVDKVCGLTVVPRMGFRAGQKVDLSFNFYISENSASREADERTSRIAGNVLTFQRGFTDSSLEWELGPIRGTWFAPMIFLDVPWIVENWETYVDHKDPFKDFH